MRYCLLFLLVAAGGVSRAGGIGSAGAEFLNIPASTRAAGMGEAFVGLADDPGALFYNPAGLANVKDLSVHYLHAFWMESISYDYLSGMVPVERYGTAGLSFTRLFTQSERITVGPQGEPVRSGNFDASQMAVAGGFGFKLVPSISAGATLKSVQQDLNVGASSAFATDLGLLYKTPLPQLSMGMQLANIGSTLDKASLPVVMKIGTAYNLPSIKGLATSWAGKGLRDMSLITSDVHFQLSPQQENFFRVRLGAEYLLALGQWQKTAFRIGYKIGEENAGGLSGITFGLGYQGVYNRFRYNIDYALVNFGDLGMTHRIAVTTSFLHLSEVKYGAIEELMKASKREGQVMIQWPASTDSQVSGYNIYMGESKDSDFTKVNREGAITGTSLALKGLKVGKTYYFFVTTVVGVEPAIEGRPFYETSQVAQPVP